MPVRLEGSLPSSHATVNKAPAHYALCRVARQTPGAVSQLVEIAKPHISELVVNRGSFDQTSVLIQSTARSPIMMQVKLVLARTILGITDASTTRSPSTPRTRQY